MTKNNVLADHELPREMGAAAAHVAFVRFGVGPILVDILKKIDLSKLQISEVWADFLYFKISCKKFEKLAIGDYHEKGNNSPSATRGCLKKGGHRQEFLPMIQPSALSG